MMIKEQIKAVGGQLGSPSGALVRTYERLKQYADSLAGNAIAARLAAGLARGSLR